MSINIFEQNSDLLKFEKQINSFLENFSLDDLNLIIKLADFFNSDIGYYLNLPTDEINLLLN